MGIRAIYTDDSGERVGCDVIASARYTLRLHNESEDEPSYLVVPDGGHPWRVRAFVHEIEFPPHKTPADWQPVMTNPPCPCEDCVEARMEQQGASQHGFVVSESEE